MNMTRPILFALITFLASTAAADGIISSVVKAPITPDGDVAGAQTDLVITLDQSIDPSVTGIPLAAGCAVRVTLPPDFVNSGLPVQDIFTPGCAPGDLNCITGIFLQGWPQHPIFPRFPPPGPADTYQLTSDGSHTLVFTALVDLWAPNVAGLPGPGLKQIHLINGFVNPKRPGFYPVHVEFTDGPMCSAESGVADVHIIPKSRPSVEFTSVFNGPGNPNSIYQETTILNDTPIPWNLLMWDRKGRPMTGVEVEMVNSDFALLKQDRRTVGHIRISAPPGADGHAVSSAAPSDIITAPVKDIPVGRLVVQFTAGSVAGRYSVEVTLVGGNRRLLVVDVI